MLAVEPVELPVPELDGQLLHAAAPVAALNVSTKQALCELGVPPSGPVYPAFARTQAHSSCVLLSLRTESATHLHSVAEAEQGRHFPVFAPSPPRVRLDFAVVLVKLAMGQQLASASPGLP